MQRTGPYADASPFPPIAQYGFLSDRHVQALIAPSGNVEWLCLPRPDSPSVFAAMLDRSAGHFRVGPRDVTVPAGRRYVPGTLVLETTWQTHSGWIIVRDALLIGPWYDDTQRAVDYQRPPDDYEAEHCLLRTIRCVNGHVELVMDCEPAPDYARSSVTWEYLGEGYSAAEARTPDGDLMLRLTSDLRMGFEGRRAYASTTLREGDERFVALSWSAHQPATSYQDAADRAWRTQEFWREWLNHGEFPDHPWRIYLQRSALTLKGLTYAPTGALVAAGTTSLPETPGGERNWDYRYSWIRDSAFALWGLYSTGFDSEADAFFEFVADRTD
ncbi:MAG: glycoside hydrolase family 15 protein, partial [Actinomycetota bacterium]